MGRGLNVCWKENAVLPFKNIVRRWLVLLAALRGGGKQS